MMRALGTTSSALIVPAIAARRALLDAQALLDDPLRATSTPALSRLIERMGFVQIDTINVVERAHHLTLFSRMHDYEPRMFAHLLEKKRSLWEHWTHDASAVPTKWFPHWKHRFERYRTKIRRNAWWKQRLGSDPEATIAMVRERIAREGPLQSRDFEHDKANHPLPEDGWWGWKPAKAALEHLWRSGELTIIKRINFQKVYDLTERAMPELHAAPMPAMDEHIDWACRSALERLGGLATPGEIAAFWHAIDPSTARRWCKEATARGELIDVLVQSVDHAKPRKVVMFAAMERRMRTLGRGAGRETANDTENDGAIMRVLSPFDPVLRDRKRCQRLFGFDYRFEAFTPGPKRTYGYYVLPLLQGERLVGRINPKFHRDRCELVIDGVWWEKGVKPTKGRKTALNEALARLAQFIGAEQVRVARD